MDKNTIEKIFLENVKINTIILLLTERCNLRCSYCYTNNWNIKDNNRCDMSIKCMNASINAIKNNDESNIIFSGGEPFLRFDLIKQTVQYVKENCRKYQFGIVTNGTLIDDYNVLFLKKNNFHVTISIDSIFEKENSYRVYADKSSSLEVVYKNIKLILLNNINITIRMTISNLNLNFYNSIRILTDMGIRNFKISYIIDKNFKIEEFQDKFFEEMDKVISYSQNKNITVFPYSKFQLQSETKKDLFNCLQCNSGLNSIVVSYNGDIYACPMLKIPEYKLGSVYNDITQIKKIVFHQMLIDKCKKCEMFKKCTTLCFARFYLISGNMYNPDKNFCEMAKFYIDQTEKRSKR